MHLMVSFALWYKPFLVVPKLLFSLVCLNYLVALEQGFGGVWSRHCWGRSLLVHCKELVHTHGVVGIQVTLRILLMFSSGFLL